MNDICNEKHNLANMIYSGRWLIVAVFLPDKIFFKFLINYLSNLNIKRTCVLNAKYQVIYSSCHAHSKTQQFRNFSQTNYGRFAKREPPIKFQICIHYKKGFGTGNYTIYIKTQGPYSVSWPVISVFVIFSFLE